MDPHTVWVRWTCVVMKFETTEYYSYSTVNAISMIVFIINFTIDMLVGYY